MKDSVVADEVSVGYDFQMDMGKQNGAQADEEPQGKQIPIKYNIREGEPIWSVDRSLIQNQIDDDFLVLSFFQSSPPIILKDGDADDVESLHAFCIGRFALTPRKAKEMMGMLAVHLGKHHPELLGMKEGDQPA